jgi:hypothetical protein
MSGDCMLGFKDYVDCFYRELHVATLLWCAYILGLLGILAVVLSYAKPFGLQQIVAISIPFVMIAYLHLQLIYYRYVTLGLLRRELLKLTKTKNVQSENLDQWVRKGLFVASSRSILSIHLGIDLVVLGVICLQPFWAV